MKIEENLDEFLRGALRGLDVKLKVFETNNSGDAGNLGLEYDFDRSLFATGDEIAFSLNVDASGNVAFERDSNPTDFLETSLKLHAFSLAELGGAVVDEQEIVDFATFFKDMSLKLARYATLEELRASEEWREYTRRWKSDYLETHIPLFSMAFSSNLRRSVLRPAAGTSAWGPRGARGAG